MRVSEKNRPERLFDFKAKKNAAQYSTLIQLSLLPAIRHGSRNNFLVARFLSFCFSIFFIQVTKIVLFSIALA